MSFYAHELGLLGLSNHKCGSTTVMRTVEELLTPTVVGVGKQQCFIEGERPYNPPWKHANLRTWYRYLDINGYPGARPLVFTTTRNPWDRMVSVYTYGHWHSKTYSDDGRQDFNEFLSNIHADDGYSFATFIRHYRIDRVLRLEHLHRDLSSLLSDVADIDLGDEPARHNASERGHYRDYYSDRSVELVWQMFAWEIETFRYEF